MDLKMYNNRARELLQRDDYKKVSLAKSIGITPQALNIAINGKDDRKIPTDYAPGIAKFFNVSTDYLFGDTNVPNRVGERPLIGKASCGVPNGYYADDFEMVQVPDEFNNDDCYVVEAEGESMLPKIEPGMQIICDKSKQVENGDIVHYAIDGESGIKKYKMNEEQDKITLMPTNMSGEFDPIMIHADDNIDFKMVKCVKRLFDGF